MISCFMTPSPQGGIVLKTECPRRAINKKVFPGKLFQALEDILRMNYQPFP